MIYVYILLCMSIIVFSLKVYKSIINPTSVFTIPWLLIVVLYELKWIKFDNLRWETYFILILTVLLFNIGCYVGWLSPKIYLSSKRLISNGNFDVNKVKYLVKKNILFCTVISSFAILIRLISIVETYGLNFYIRLAQIYGEKLTGEFTGFEIPYMGSFIFIAVVLVGFYYAKFGFEKFLFFPIFIVILIPLTSGTKQWIVQCIILFFLSVLLTGINYKRKSLLKFYRDKILIFISMIIVIGVFYNITNQRSTYVNSSNFNSYATKEFSAVVSRVPATYQIYTYLATPVGVLNAYLENPTFEFGRNTLLPVYNVLNKFGFDFNVERFQTFYYIPIRTNVGTAVRELIEDYHYIFTFVLVFTLGCISGNQYKKYIQNKNIYYVFMNSFILLNIGMSWFVWLMRDANIIIAFVLGLLIVKKILKKSIY